MIDQQRQTQHLFWRAGMGLTPGELEVRGQRTTNDLIAELFDASHTWTALRTDHTPLTREQYRKMPKTERNAMLRANRGETGRLNLLWMARLAATEGCLREKMALFWHGHFACWTHWSLSAEHYLNTLREHALGNFGTLLKAVSRTPAMLEYLNNQQNRKGAPNENFAREVMELFTLGRGQYSEQDIQEAARAFTGWGFEPGTADFRFREQWHDGDAKTFRGHTGNFDGDDILDLIIKDRRCAEFICRRLHRWFVHPEVDEAFVSTMTDRFFTSGYDIADLMRFVFTSDHFRSDRVIGARVKSPVELICGLDKLFTIRFADEATPLFLQRSLGQVLLHPPSVAGWTNGNGWIDSNALLARLKLPSALLNQGELDWGEPDASPDEMDRMMVSTDVDAPMRDARGRKIVVAIDRDGFLAQLPAEVTDERLFSTLLAVAPSTALRGSLSPGDAWQCTIEVLSSPEYQLC